MIKFLQIAFRGVFRNTRRTALTLLVISCGVIALVLAGGFFALGYRRNPAALGILAIALSGLLELLQLIVPGRHARPSDFAINAFAACLGIAAVWLSGRIRRYG